MSLPLGLTLLDNCPRGLILVATVGPVPILGYPLGVRFPLSSEELLLYFLGCG